MDLADLIGRWIGKVEIVLAGADDDLREGQQALGAGEPMRARAAAHRVLERAPGSPVGLALLADASEGAHLYAELALTLEELARRAPRAEVWLRLARARRATASPVDDVRDALVRGLALADAGSEARRELLLELADQDLAEDNGARAELWLDRAALPDASEAAAVRRVEARLLRGDAAGANKLIDRLDRSPADGRAALARGRVLAMLGDPAAFPSLLRAMVLDTAGASEALSDALSSLPSDPQIRARVRSVVDAKGEQDAARWRAAFARAEGERDAARRALREALAAGDTGAARPLLDAAIDDRDPDSLSIALRNLPAEDSERLVADARLVSLAAGVREDDPASAGAQLDWVARITHPRVVPWADAVAERAARRWFPPSGSEGERMLADWASVLSRLDMHARSLSDLESVAAVADLAAERNRPLRVAIVGEFNAGKSTFINALIGEDVAPTGVLPTTATLHHLRWAPDRIARIFFTLGHEPPERIVPLPQLRATLKDVDSTGVRRVELLLPLAFLLRVEILDTPGFNAPDDRHTQAARSAFEEADAAIWLLDATQALKKSERDVLEEAERAHLPVQVLVNKSDRLKSHELERVMGGVTEALVGVGIRSLSPPLALSAKRALAGKLGDAAALADSGWTATQELLETQIVSRHAELKERALRRRAGRIVGRLAGQVAAEAEGQRSQEEALAVRAHSVGGAAAWIEGEAHAFERQLLEQLAPAAQEWAEDLALVFVGRDPTRAAADPALAHYRAERAVLALASPLARALAALAPEALLTASQLGPTARALTRAAAEACPQPDADALLSPLARAAIATLVEQLFALSVAPASRSRSVAMARELRALSEALE